MTVAAVKALVFAVLPQRMRKHTLLYFPSLCLPLPFSVTIGLVTHSAVAAFYIDKYLYTIDATVEVACGSQQSISLDSLLNTLRWQGASGANGEEGQTEGFATWLLMNC